MMIKSGTEGNPWSVAVLVIHQSFMHEVCIILVVDVIMIFSIMVLKDGNTAIRRIKMITYSTVNQ